MTLYPALEKLLELSEKATPGEWRRGYEDEHGCAWVGTGCNNPDAKGQGYNFSARVAECDFIVAAHAALPELRALLADVRKKDQQAQQVDFGDERPDVRRKEWQPDDVREREVVAWMKNEPEGPDHDAQIRGTLFIPDRTKQALMNLMPVEAAKYSTPLYTSPPSQQAVDVEDALYKFAVTMKNELAAAMSSVNIQLAIERDNPKIMELRIRKDSLTALLEQADYALSNRKHLVSPREGWVKCSERMPVGVDWYCEPQASVIAASFTENGHCVFWRKARYVTTKRGEKFIAKGWYDAEEWIPEPTHWMPLPSPPLAPTVGEK